MKLFLDFVGGGAWPFLVGGVICLVDSDNERDANLLNRGSGFLASESHVGEFLKGSLFLLDGSLKYRENLLRGTTAV